MVCWPPAPLPVAAPCPAARQGANNKRQLGYRTMAQQTTKPQAQLQAQPQAQPQQTPQQTPQQAAMAKLAAELASAGGSAGGIQVTLAKLPRGKFDLRGAAKAIGYTIPVKANGKPNKAPLRRALANMVAQGQLVTLRTGGYANSAGGISAGTNWYMRVE